MQGLNGKPAAGDMNAFFSDVSSRCERSGVEDDRLRVGLGSVREEVKFRGGEDQGRKG